MNNTENKKTIYLASPYGFSQLTETHLLPRLVAELDSLGLEVWEPFARNNQHKGTKDAGYKIGQADKEDTINADAIFAVVNGLVPDPGVMVELGIAIALNKPTFLFHDEFQSMSDNEDYPLNLMVFTGLGKDDWRNYYYESIYDIGNKDKALVKWVNNEL